jgi:hypothetical protein
MAKKSTPWMSRGAAYRSDTGGTVKVGKAVKAPPPVRPPLKSRGKRKG